MAVAPIYYMLGQDSFRGSIDEAWLTENKNEDLDDAEPLVNIYDHDGAAADTYDTTPGSALSNTNSAADKLLIACDAKMVRDILANQHAAGFSLIKYTADGAVGNSGSNRWAKTYAESYAVIGTADTAVRAVITGAGDTPTPKGCFLSVGYAEGVIGSPTLDAAFKADVQTLMGDLRTDYVGAGNPIVFDFPPASVSGASAAQLTSLAAARKAIIEICYEDTNASYIVTDDLARCSGAGTVAGRMLYTGAATMELGKRLAAEMERLVDGKPSASSTGIPTYILLGDEGTVGVVEDTFLTAESQQTYDGPITGSYIWNHASGAWEALDGTVNSNTGADGTTKFGPDVAMITQMIQSNHPGQDVALYKLGVNQSALGNPAATGGSWAKADADLYTEALDGWSLAKAAMVTVLGKVPDVRGIIWNQAEEDVASDALAAAYQANLQGHVANLRADFGTRTDGVAALTPVVIPRMIDTGKYDAARVSALRDAQTEFARIDRTAILIDQDDLVVHSNNQNLAGSGIHELGQRIAEKLAVALRSSV